MMKKLLALILVGLLALSVVSCGDKKEDKEENDESTVVEQNYIEETANKGKFEYALNSEGDYEIVKYDAYETTASDITLPSEVNGRDIVGIADNTFKRNSSIKTVTVPATYKYIGEYAFYDCDALTSISLPATLESIGKGAFEGCDVLADFKLPAGVTEISECAFKDCKLITSMDLTNVKKIQKNAFFNCSALTSLTVSDKIEYATKDAFYECDALVYHEEGELLYLGNEANKTVLLVSPATLNITECAVSATTKVVADAAFRNCKYLTKITLSNSVTVINGTSFEACPELNYNESENGLYLGTAENPYMVLVGLDIKSKEDFTLNKDTKIIADSAFVGCAALKDISYAGTEDDWKAIVKSENWSGDLVINVVFG